MSACNFLCGKVIRNSYQISIYFYVLGSMYPAAPAIRINAIGKE